MIVLAVLAVILFGIVLALYMRRWSAAGPRERALLRTTLLLCPLAGAAFGLLLWLVERALPASSLSPGALFLLAYPVLAALSAILWGRRLRQIRAEEGTL